MRRSAFILAVLVASIAVISASDRRSLRPATRLRGLMALFGSTTDPSSSNNPTTSNTSKENSKTTTTPNPNPNPNRSIPLGTPGGTANGGTGNAKEVTTGTATSAKSTPANITASKPSSNGNDKGSGNTDDSESKGKRNTCDVELGDQSYCCGNPGQCHTHPKYCTWCSDNCCCDPCNPSCWNYDKCDKKGCGNVCSDCPTKPACENGRPKNCCWQSYGPGNNNGVCRDAGACNGGGECTSANCSAPKSCKDGQCVCVKDGLLLCCISVLALRVLVCRDKAGAQCSTGGKCWDGSSCPVSCTCLDGCAANNNAGYTDCRLNYPAFGGGHGCKPNFNNPKGYECPACNSEGTSCGPGFRCDEPQGIPTCVPY
ncbi:hypothetical protein C2E21_1884 [Chlorella sorokiniana]|uniref:Uncharacterized protein n=1 Tax=Chlorella sorokiniana TaxID=3076 RepID=A0A2P6U1H6_CHLSO|nr:hypothetical protein C2E21_1884 [Chlorella sorokiniana]|eukprot:PRW60173.1 hypothetical protein C2E21_1884 [Chlorella sorokiniana]